MDKKPGVMVLNEYYTWQEIADMTKEDLKKIKQRKQEIKAKEIKKFSNNRD